MIDIYTFNHYSAYFTGLLIAGLLQNRRFSLKKVCSILEKKIQSIIIFYLLEYSIDSMVGGNHSGIGHSIFNISIHTDGIYSRFIAYSHSIYWYKTIFLDIRHRLDSVCIMYGNG